MFNYLRNFLNSLYYYLFPCPEKQIQERLKRWKKYCYDIVVYKTKRDDSFIYKHIDDVFGSVELKFKNKEVYDLPLSFNLDKSIQKCIDEFYDQNEDIDMCYVYLFYIDQRLVNVYVTNESDITCEGCKLFKEVSYKGSNDG